VIATEGVTLTYVNPSPNTRAVRGLRRAAPSHTRGIPATTAERGGWRLPLYIQDEQGHSVYSTIGQSPHGSDQYVPALDAAIPPPFTRGASIGVRFPHSDWDSGVGRSGGDFLTDIRRSGSASTWKVAVDIPQPEHTYTLGWGGTARLPRNTSLTLVDLDTGVRRLMNSSSSYTFTAAKGETTRQFQIVAEPHHLSFVTITNLRVDAPTSVGGRAVQSANISFELNGVAESSVQIRGPSGRIVRHLAQGRATAAGLNQMVWDLKDDRGITLPTGIYTVEVQARTSDGRQTRAIAVHPIVR
jgi:hypothetical protein